MKHNVHMDDIHISSYANLVLLQRLYARIENNHWSKERKNFLLNELKSNGYLKCHYCNKNDLKLNTTKKSDQATVDHYIPKSVGGNQFSSSNFVVCCHSCNRAKGNMTAEEFLKSEYIKKKTS